MHAFVSPTTATGTVVRIPAASPNRPTMERGEQQVPVQDLLGFSTSQVPGAASTQPSDDLFGLTSSGTEQRSAGSRSADPFSSNASKDVLGLFDNLSVGTGAVQTAQATLAQTTPTNAASPFNHSPHTPAFHQVASPIPPQSSPSPFSSTPTGQTQHMPVAQQQPHGVSHVTYPASASMTPGNTAQHISPHHVPGPSPQFLHGAPPVAQYAPPMQSGPTQVPVQSSTFPVPTAPGMAGSSPSQPMYNHPSHQTQPQSKRSPFDPFA